MMVRMVSSVGPKDSESCRVSAHLGGEGANAQHT